MRFSISGDSSEAITSAVCPMMGQSILTPLRVEFGLCDRIPRGKPYFIRHGWVDPSAIDVFPNVFVQSTCTASPGRLKESCSDCRDEQVSPMFPDPHRFRATTSL